MASRASEPNAGVLRAPGLGRCLGSSAPESQASFEDPMQVPGSSKDPAAAKSPGLPRNVLSERERRKRISASCERLRALLPRFDGRREDMASVLEMAVQFLRLANILVPGWEQHRVSWPSSLGSRPPPWPACTWQPTSPKMSEEATIRRSQAGPPARGTMSPGRLAGEVALMPAMDTRSAFGLDLEDGESFPLSASPEWWLGSVEARGATPARASARSSPVGRAEPGFLGDTVPSSQELQDGPMELWGSDVDTWGLDLRDDGVDSIFADFLAC